MLRQLDPPGVTIPEDTRLQPKDNCPQSSQTNLALIRCIKISSLQTFSEVWQAMVALATEFKKIVAPMGSG